MDFHFRPINMEYVNMIDSWDYEGFVEEVIMKPYFDFFNETGVLKGPGGCEGFVAFLDEKPVGLFEFKIEDRSLEIGLALKPEFIGKGLGAQYVKQGIAFGLQYYDQNIEDIKLVVESENKAAIRVYEKVGFKQVKEDDEIEMRMSV